MTTGRKLVLLGAVIAGVTAWFAWQGAAGSWQYYVTADECLARAADLAGNRVRVSGKVAAGTLQIAADRRQAEFSLQAAERALPVRCAGPVPDNLGENMDVVVEGRLESGRLQGDKVLTRCASKYEPKAASLADPTRPGREEGR